jgi:hypothetical protein
MKARLLLAVALFLVMGGAVTPAAADDTEVPFKAAYTTYPTAVFNPATNCLEQVIPADGQAMHLGESAFYTGDMRSCLAGASQYGSMNLTAANGDELDGTFAGNWSIDAEGVAHFQGKYQFTGGTGRFAGVSGGSGDYWGTARPGTPAGLGMLYFEGTLKK